MKRNNAYSASPNRRETVAGFCYLAFQMLCLPLILSWGNLQLSHPLNEAELNFVFYLVNFIAVLQIIHDFLSNSLTQVFRHPIVFAEGVILGAVAYYALFWLTNAAVSLLVPSFSNYNDEAIMDMLGSNRLLILVGTVVLVPITEECLYRGLIFRNLYGKSRWAAYLVSILVFAVIHILGYIGLYSPVELLLAFLQYLPAGLCLAWAYIRGGTIFAPIVIHSLVNYISINGIR